jgi:glucose/arabinose dehydrogenase
MTVYNSDTFPIQNDLLVVLHGSYNQSNLEGYALALIEFNDQNQPEKYRVIIPEQTINPENPPSYIYPLSEIQ